MIQELESSRRESIRRVFYNCQQEIWFEVKEMAVEKETRPAGKKHVLVGVLIDSQKDLLSWALVKVAEPGDCVVAIHVTRNSDQALRDKLLLESYLQVYEGLCSAKKVELRGQIFQGRSVRKILVRETKSLDAVALVVGASRQSTLGGWASTAKYCAKQLPPTTNVLAIHNGKIIFTRFNDKQLPGLQGDPRPSLYQFETQTRKQWLTEFGDSESGSDISSFDGIKSSTDGSRDSSLDSRDETLSVISQSRKLSSQSTSLFEEDILDHRPGWPLLRRASSSTIKAMDARKMSVVRWVMDLPSRSPQITPRCSSIVEDQFQGEVQSDMDERKSTSSFALHQLQKGLDILLKSNSSDCAWFSYEVLETATSHFSSENLIGKGGSNSVYKGTLPDDKQIAVKILKSSNEAWKDFTHEVDIISSLNHKHIMPILGVCIQENDLIAVYNFSSKGSLEEILHGKNKHKHAFPWEVRFNVAIGIAEALNYLHNEGSRPVIHRDVKSSNILLSDTFEPQLSDFGLAIWGPTASSFLIQADVVGTFGYLAPEYFMYGKVSDKIDVYAFGVVLLELLSGKRPIGSQTAKGQECLVMWAEPLMECGNLKGLLDPDLDENVNKDQMERMILAATLCITRSARLRPKINEILELLRGERPVEKLASHEDAEDEGNDDEVYPNSSTELHIGLALLDADLHSTSSSSLGQTSSICAEENLKERWSRSPSFD